MLAQWRVVLIGIILVLVGLGGISLWLIPSFKVENKSSFGKYKISKVKGSIYLWKMGYWDQLNKVKVVYTDELQQTAQLRTGAEKVVVSLGVKKENKNATIFINYTEEKFNDSDFIYIKHPFDIDFYAALCMAAEEGMSRTVPCYNKAVEYHKWAEENGVGGVIRKSAGFEWLLSLFSIKIVYAQTCNSAAYCGLEVAYLCCSSTGTSCENIGGDCGPGDLGGVCEFCGTNCDLNQNPTNCTGFSDEYTCTIQTVSNACAGTYCNPNFSDPACSWDSGPSPTIPPTTPTPTGEPTPTPVPNNVAGSHDGFSGTQYSSECRAAGWSTDPDDTSQKVEIRFRTRISGGTWGSWVGAGQANLYRSDLESVCPGSNGYCAFDFSLLNNVEFDVAYDVAVQGRDINTGNYVNLSNTPRTITCVEPSQNTCSISATPAQTNEGEYTQVSLTGTVQGDGGSVPEVRVWVSKQNQSNIPNYNLSSVISPQPVSEYQNPSPSIYYYHIHAAGCTPGSGTNSCSNTANLYLPQGDYYLHCDVPDDPGKCSGNPYCDYEALGPNLINCTAGGWQSCSGNDNLTYQVFPAPAQCTVNLTPNTASISVGGSQQYLADVTDVQGGTIDRVDFRSLQTSVATVSPTSDPTPAYRTTATGVSTGDATIQADVVMGGANICSDTASLTVVPPEPWWQVRDADVMAAGSISSIIPVTCTPTACTPSFNLKGTGGYPGVNIFGGTFSVGTNPDATAGEGFNWLANTTYAGKNPDGSQKRYGLKFFYDQLPEDIRASMNIGAPGRITSSSPGSTFWTGIGNGPAPIIRGYRWYYYDGNDGYGRTLNIDGNINLTGSTRRVVLFVANANLSINGRINVQDGVSFFMTVVGKSGTSYGRITVNQAVGGTGGPHLEGIFLAERDLLTSASANRLHVRGSVVAYDGVSLDRDLVDANVNTSAELFEYGVDQVMLIPPQMMLRKILWQEVLP